MKLLTMEIRTIDEMFDAIRTEMLFLEEQYNTVMYTLDEGGKVKPKELAQLKQAFQNLEHTIGVFRQETEV